MKISEFRKTQNQLELENKKIIKLIKWHKAELNQMTIDFQNSPQGQYIIKLKDEIKRLKSLKKTKIQ